MIVQKVLHLFLFFIFGLVLFGNAFPQVYTNNIISNDKTETGYNLHIDKQKPVHISQDKHLFVGNCALIDNDKDQESVIVYKDHTIIENEGPSTLNGTIEIYIDSPVKITCIKVMNQINDDSEAAIPVYKSGGIGFNWVFIDVFCKYSKGFDFYIEIFGKYRTTEVK